MQDLGSWALLMINKKFLDEVISDVLKSDLHGMTKECGTTHVEVYIFKDFRYKKAIEWAWKIQGTFGVGPEADLIWGKIFGYSDKEIMDETKWEDEICDGETGESPQSQEKKENPLRDLKGHQGEAN